MTDVTATPANEPGIWNSVFIKAFIVNMLSQYGNYSMNTLSSPFADSMGAAATIVGLVSGLFALTALIFKFVSAPAIDSFDRKKVLIFSLSIMLASFVGYSLSHSIPMLIVSRLLTGVGLAFVPTCCIAIASDALPANKMSTGIGFFALGTVVTQAIAPTAGLKLVSMVGYNMTFAILGLLMFLTILFAGTMKVAFKPISRFRISLKSVYAGEVLVPTVILFLTSGVFCNVNAFLILFGKKQGITSSHIGYFFTVLAVTMVVSRPLIGRLADTFGSGKVIIGSMVFFAASFLVISYATTLPVFLFAGFLSAFGYAGSQPALMAVCMKSVPTARRGAASCTSYIGQDLGNLAGPVLAGAIIQSMGYVSMWRLMIAPIAAAMIITILFRYSIDHAGQTPATPGHPR